MSDIARLKTRRKEAHRDLQRSDRNVERQKLVVEQYQLERRELAEEGATEADIQQATARIRQEQQRLEEMRETRERRKEDWKSARNAVKAALKDKHAEPKLDTSLGDPHYGGSMDVVEQLIDPVIVRLRGSAAVGSGKRWETYGNPGSDHYAGNADAGARDARVANHDYELQNAIGEALDIDGPVRDYAAYFIEVDGHTFRYQGIAAPHGTGPHQHNGVKRA